MRYRERRKNTRSVLCVGLDPDLDRLPEGYPRTIQGLEEHLKEVILCTHGFAVAYKPNSAFFESWGAAGWEMLKRIVHFIQSESDCLVILDAKRGDLGNTASHYARAAFDELKADAITLSPYMGRESLEPFLLREKVASFVLCLTSNSGALDFQYHGNPPLYEKVASLCNQWHGTSGNLGLVVGATRDPSELRSIRSLAPDLIFLVPGVGSQGGDLDAVMSVAGPDVLINASRSVLFASHHRRDVPARSSEEAGKLVQSMQKHLHDL